MDLRQLRYFLGVCSHGSIARAARHLHIAQPALSRQISGLEKEMGAPLFERLPRGVALTRAGEELKARALDILERAQAVAGQVRIASSGMTGVLRIGVLPGYTGMAALAQAVSALLAATPQVRVSIEPMFSAEQLARLSRQELDVGIVGWRSPFDSAFIGRTICSDPMLLAIPRHSPLARKRGALFLQDLAGEPLLMFGRERSPAHYDALVQAFEQAGQALRAARISVFDIPSAVSMVASGLGCAIVPSTFRTQWQGQIVFKEIADLHVAVQLELVRRAEGADPLVDRFVGLWP